MRLKAYVADGGFLVVTNSEVAHIMTVPASDPNEDDLDINTLLGPMGAAFTSSNYEDGTAFVDRRACSEPGCHDAQHIR